MTNIHCPNYFLFIVAVTTFVNLACGSSAMLIPLAPFADDYPDNPMVHK
ncbi:MAG: hypothetical protein JW748_08260 [Anaerolineales bacterium]|nr:hypothetical protein [Anaerolineales bacterium]